jgi:predicted transcriptional regulator
LPVVYSIDRLSQGSVSGILKAMDTRSKPQQEAQPSPAADDAQFRAAVLQGIEQADRGEFIEEAEMDARVERMLRS